VYWEGEGTAGEKIGKSKPLNLSGLAVVLTNSKKPCTGYTEKPENASHERSGNRNYWRIDSSPVAVRGTGGRRPVPGGEMTGALRLAFSALVFRAFKRGFSAATASLLIFLFLIPPDAGAKTKPLDAATAHARIVKRGINSVVGVEESNGLILGGRIIAINPDSFTLQLFNDPQPVTIGYADVTAVQTGPTRGFWIATGVGIAAVTGFAIWGFVHVHNLQRQDQLPGTPAMP
jgi:hypothetical protein